MKYGGELYHSDLYLGVCVCLVTHTILLFLLQSCEYLAV